MTTHVFIVDWRTFPVHLEYGFAGTTSGEAKANNIRLLSDIKRTRPGDQVIFYVNRVGFYGVFRISDQNPLVLHEKDDPGYLRDKLQLRLIYRTRIEPATVYPIGVSEWDALDKLPLYAREVLWSLIYRKLKGERGCTPIFPHEASRLLALIENANPRGPLDRKNITGLTWDSRTEQIVPGKLSPYEGSKTAPPNIRADLVKKAKKGDAHEAYLEAYLAESAGIDAALSPICGEPSQLRWLGNQVYCGVGMQKIDIFTILEDRRSNKEFRVVELKDEPLGDGIYQQLLRYVEWTKMYIPDAINSNVQPIAVSRRVDRTDKSAAAAELTKLNSENRAKVARWFEYWSDGKSLFFEDVKY